MKETFSVTAEISLGILEGLTIERKINKKIVAKKFIDSREVSQAAVDYCTENNIF